MPLYIPAGDYAKGVTSAITDLTSTAVIAAPGAGNQLFITDILVTNSHASVGTVVQILSNATVIWTGYARAEGGYVMAFGVPIACAVNEALNAKCLTTGASVYVSAAGYRARV